MSFILCLWCYISVCFGSLIKRIYIRFKNSLRYLGIDSFGEVRGVDLVVSL